MGEDGVVHFYNGEKEERPVIYVALASFVTSYGRMKIITDFQKVLDDYNSGKSNIIPLYSDTDSLHLYSPEFKLPEGIEINDTELGKFKFESRFCQAKFLRQKCYIESSTEDINNPDPEYKLKVTVAGMPKDCHKYVTYKNFKIGASYKGKKAPKIVRGGVVLEEIDFTIKP